MNNDENKTVDGTNGIEKLVNTDLIINKEDIIPGNIYQIYSKNQNKYFIGILDNSTVHAYLTCENPEDSYLVTADNNTLKDNAFTIADEDIIFELSESSLTYAQALFDGFNVFWNNEKRTVEKVFFLEDLNILPLDKFLGIKLNKLYNRRAIGSINFDILCDYKPTVGGNYIGISGEKYRCVLPYSDTTYELWKRYKRGTVESLIKVGLNMKNYTLKESKT